MKLDHNAMTSNSKDDKNKKNTDKDTNEETTNRKPSAGNLTSDKKTNETNETNETNSTKNLDSNLNQTKTESEFRRRLSEESICGGIMGEITPECVSKMKNIEEKKKKDGSK